jgi:hypothetical protein
VSDGGDEAVAGVDDEVVADLRLHRTPVLLAIVVAWSFVVVVGLARGLVLSNGKGVLFILGLLVVVARMGFTVRGLWRQAHRVSWTSGGSLVLHTLGGPRTARLEPPIAVHRYEATVASTEGADTKVIYAVIRSEGESLVVTTSRRRADQLACLATAIADATGSDRPEQKAIGAGEHTGHVRDTTVRWLNGAGAFTVTSFGAGLIGLLVVPAVSVLAVVAMVAPPSGETSMPTTLGETRSQLSATRQGLVSGLRGAPAVDGPPTEPVAEVSTTTCSRESGHDGWLWGPSDAAQFEATAVVTLRAEAVPGVSQRLDEAAEPSGWHDTAWDYWPEGPVTSTKHLWFVLDGRELSVELSTWCLTPEDRRELRPFVEAVVVDHLAAVAGAG